MMLFVNFRHFHLNNSAMNCGSVRLPVFQPCSVTDFTATDTIVRAIAFATTFRCDAGSATVPTSTMTLPYSSRLTCADDQKIGAVFEIFILPSRRFRGPLQITCLWISKGDAVYLNGDF
jgi:hypothetical protein